MPISRLRKYGRGLGGLQFVSYRYQMSHLLICRVEKAVQLVAAYNTDGIWSVVVAAVVVVLRHCDMWS